MKKETILRFMLREHGILRDLLATFRAYSDRNSKRAEIAFKKFKNKQKTHVFIEEKGIFNFNKKIKKISILKLIVAQHKAIEEMIKKILTDLDNEEDPTKGVIVLQASLYNHVNLEEKKLYPKIDEQITDEEREKILKKIYKILK